MHVAAIGERQGLGAGIKRLAGGGEAGEIDDVADGEPGDGHLGEAVGIAGYCPARTRVELQRAEIGDRVAETRQRANRDNGTCQLDGPPAAIHLAVEHSAGGDDEAIAEVVRADSEFHRVGARSGGDHRPGIGERAGNACKIAYVHAAVARDRAAREIVDRSAFEQIDPISITSRRGARMAGDIAHCPAVFDGTWTSEHDARSTLTGDRASVGIGHRSSEELGDSDSTDQLPIVEDLDIWLAARRERGVAVDRDGRASGGADVAAALVGDDPGIVDIYAIGAAADRAAVGDGGGTRDVDAVRACPCDRAVRFVDDRPWSCDGDAGRLTGDRRLSLVGDRAIGDGTTRSAKCDAEMISTATTDHAGVIDGPAVRSITRTIQRVAVGVLDGAGHRGRIVTAGERDAGRILT
jgi:hypothetical protein